jgi:NAD(P)-dependent dehydrogenase (short-subunit alcohol dehydrogenase family)
VSASRRSHWISASQPAVGALRSGGTGFLINVASNAAYQPTPNMAVYGAAKAFVLSFTESLLGTGLRVLALSPGATSTEFFDVVGTDAADGGTPRQIPAQVVDTALRVLDRKNPPPSVVSGRRNQIMAFGGRFLSPTTAGQPAREDDRSSSATRISNSSNINRGYAAVTQYRPATTSPPGHAHRPIGGQSPGCDRAVHRG